MSNGIGIDFKWDIKGFDDLTKALEGLAVKDARRIMRKAGREAMVPVQLSMAVNAGYDPESDGAHMREEIAMSTKLAGLKADGVTHLRVRVGPKKIHAVKAIAQEYGTDEKKHQEAKPFMRPALYDHKDDVVKRFSEVMSDGINKAIKKYAKQAAKAAKGK